MEWFKENWFKLGILIVIMLIGIFYITNYKNSEMEIVALKEKCIKNGKDYVSNSFLENPPEEMTVSKEFIYSPELKTCLVDISRITSPLHWYYAVIDIYTEQEIASYTLDKTDKTSWTSTTIINGYEKYNTTKNKYFPQ